MLIPFEGVLPEIHETAWLAETAVVIGDVEIGEHSSVWYNCVLRGDHMPIRVGKRTNIQDGSVLHIESGKYDCVLGDDITVGHMAIVHGCHVGDGAVIAMGAIVLNNVKVGEGAVVGAGAVVPENKVIDPGTLWLGAPAKYVRDLNDEEIKRFKNAAVSYMNNKERFRNS